MKGFENWVWGLGFGVWGLGVGGWGFGCRVGGWGWNEGKRSRLTGDERDLFPVFSAIRVCFCDRMHC